MTSSSLRAARDYDRIRALIADWFRQRAPGSVRLTHVDRPKPDHHASYTVVYEAIFEPVSLYMARLEIWVTQDGQWAIGLETFDRLARRLSVGCRRSGFAAGHEPIGGAGESLLKLMDVVAGGQIAIETTSPPVVGLIGTRAIARDSTLALLREHRYPALGWLHQVSDSAAFTLSNVVQFGQWA